MLLTPSFVYVVCSCCPPCFHASSPRLQALCAKHNIPYRVCGLVEGTLEVLQCLKDVAMELQEGPVM